MAVNTLSYIDYERKNQNYTFFEQIRQYPYKFLSFFEILKL